MVILEESIKEVLVLKNYVVGGEWIESKGQMKDVMNPITQKVIAKTPISTSNELNAIIEA